MTLIVKFHIEDETFSIVKIVTDMQEYDCAIEVPRLITSLYGFALTMNKHDSTTVWGSLSMGCANHWSSNGQVFQKIQSLSISPEKLE